GGNGGDIDNGPAACARHRRYGVFAAQKHAIKINGVYPAPIRQAGVLNAALQSYASIVDQYVQTAKSGFCDFQSMLPLTLICYIMGNSDDFISHGCGGVCEFVFRNVG